MGVQLAGFWGKSPEMEMGPMMAHDLEGPYGNFQMSGARLRGSCLAQQGFQTFRRRGVAESLLHQVLGRFEAQNVAIQMRRDPNFKMTQKTFHTSRVRTSCHGVLGRCFNMFQHVSTPSFQKTCRTWHIQIENAKVLEYVGILRQNQSATIRCR